MNSSGMPNNSAALSRFASEIISNNTFKKVIKESDYDFFYKKVNQYYQLEYYDKSEKTSHFFKYIYNNLSQNYRTEYLYKNTIVNELINNKSLLQDSVAVLNEFKVGKSIADLVFINGVDKAFEIKTELDSPERLRSQIADYKKMFTQVFLVCHWTNLDKYLKTAKLYDIGLIILKDDLVLETIEDAPISNDFLDRETMIRTLRKTEILSLIKNLNGYIPIVPNTIFSQTCLDIVNSHKVIQVHKLVMHELKSRQIKQTHLLISHKTIKELKHICLCLDLNEHEYESLYTLLDSPLITPELI